MRHFALHQTALRAFVSRHSPATVPDARISRLSRWAEVLEASSGPIWLYRNLENVPDLVRDLVPCRRTALTLAASDPMLRMLGLRTDRYDLGLRFFGLSEDEAHWALCYCQFGLATTVPAQAIAARIRELANGLSDPGIEARR